MDRLYENCLEKSRIRISRNALQAYSVKEKGHFDKAKTLLPQISVQRYKIKPICFEFRLSSLHYLCLLKKFFGFHSAALKWKDEFCFTRKCVESTQWTFDLGLQAGLCAHLLTLSHLNKNQVVLWIIFRGVPVFQRISSLFKPIIYMKIITDVYTKCPLFKQ